MIKIWHSQLQILLIWCKTVESQNWVDVSNKESTALQWQQSVKLMIYHWQNDINVIHFGICWVFFLGFFCFLGGFCKRRKNTILNVMHVNRYISKCTKLSLW